MGFFGNENPWGGGMGSMPGGNMSPWGSPSPWQTGGPDPQGRMYDRPANMSQNYYQSANPFSSFAPVPQGPAGGPAPMQQQQPMQSPPDPFMQLGQQPAPFGGGGSVPGYGGGMDSSWKFMGQQPQQGQMGQAGGNMSPQQPSNPFAKLGQFGW